MGHALMYRIFFREKDWHISIGTGRTLVKRERLTIRALPIRGFCHIEPKTQGTKFQYIMFYLGGPLANVLFLVLLGVFFRRINVSEFQLEQPNLAWFLAFVFWTNLYQFLGTIVPIEYRFWPDKGYASDGLKIARKARETSIS
jgi:hypothetical protein